MRRDTDTPSKIMFVDFPRHNHSPSCLSSLSRQDKKIFYSSAAATSSPVCPGIHETGQ